MTLLKKYFPELTEQQLQSYKVLLETLSDWNRKINVVSRKDSHHFETRHLLHSLSIAKFVTFIPGTRIIDVGTGGGFPGLPLAIYFPGCHFTLVDSIGKKIRVVNEIIQACGIANVTTIHARAEALQEKYHFVVSRAVTAYPGFYALTSKLILKGSSGDLKNGILYLKGGNLEEELQDFREKIKLIPISDWFEEEWFREKYIVYMAT